MIHRAFTIPLPKKHRKLIQKKQHKIAIGQIFPQVKQEKIAFLTYFGHTTQKMETAKKSKKKIEHSK